MAAAEAEARKNKWRQPIVVDGKVIGGTWASGAAGHEDEQIAAAGIKALG